MTDDTQKVTRTGLILAATLILQGLRLVIPIPPQISLFLIGLCQRLPDHGRPCRRPQSRLCRRRLHAHLCLARRMLPFVLFVFPVAIGNGVYVYCAWRWQKHGLPALLVGALAKAATLYALFYLLFAGIEFPPAMRHLLLTAMSWPQIITGVIGALLAWNSVAI